MAPTAGPARLQPLFTHSLGASSEASRGSFKTPVPARARRGAALRTLYGTCFDSSATSFILRPMNRLTDANVFSGLTTPWRFAIYAMPAPLSGLCAGPARCREESARPHARCPPPHDTASAGHR